MNKATPIYSRPCLLSEPGLAAAQDLDVLVSNRTSGLVGVTAMSSLAIALLP